MWPLRERVSAAVSEFLGNVTVGEAERDAELRSWLEGNFLSKEDMQRQLEKVCLYTATFIIVGTRLRESIKQTVDHLQWKVTKPSL